MERVNTKRRATVSLLLLITFIIVFLTGIAAKNKAELKNLHALFGFVMLVLVVIHLSINFKVFLNEIKSLFRKERKLY